MSPLDPDRPLVSAICWDFDRIIVPHGEALETGGRERLAAGFAFL
jgi:hypothetical protein